MLCFMLSSFAIWRHDDHENDGLTDAAQGHFVTWSYTKHQQVLWLRMISKMILTSTPSAPSDQVNFEITKHKLQMIRTSTVFPRRLWCQGSSGPGLEWFCSFCFTNISSKNVGQKIGVPKLEGRLAFGSYVCGTGEAATIGCEAWRFVFFSAVHCWFGDFFSWLIGGLKQCL